MNILASTGDDFYGRGRASIWEKEDNSWYRMMRASDYQYPKLHVPTYNDYAGIANSEDCSVVLCQGISWACDGTSLVAVHDDFGIRQYLIPEGSNMKLAPFHRFFKSQSLLSHAVHPGHSLFEDDDSHKVILVSSHDLPVQMYSLSTHNDDQQLKSLFNYSTANTANEKFMSVYGISFVDYSQFLTGSARNTICLYDVARTNPIWTSQTTRRVCGKSNHRAIVSCFDEVNERHDEVRYAGTYKSELIRVDPRTGHIATWKSLKGTGHGIYQILRSDNGHYLYILQRNSKIISVVDIRYSMSTVNELHLPFKILKQKMWATYSTTYGILVGNEDGRILRWSRDSSEFGGLTNTGAPDADASTPTLLVDLEMPSCRINNIQQSPKAANTFAVSYTSDKFDTTDPNPLSGIMLLEL
ncbi:HBR521Cp [Eremothecium sinecaudum]|uniref:Protein SWT21 n=1 Tax=Eremothecium sinecaudum TaxID=45286 RepID=A0A109UY31_9SACH|nr:HBR521Cp [Eremothecium sinecaudum]AMD19422.1 HBR521Cp [Eremothecium sinecaudum]